MNLVIVIGRLAAEARVNEAKTVARFALAVNRIYSKDGSADFINIIAFGRNVSFVEKYLKKGMKICVVGHINTSRYVKSDGSVVYPTEVIADRFEFVESKAVGVIGVNELSDDNKEGED